ncbi:hypothetical protein GGR55DRAFT_581998 [Xylaria sp. FL0064]|nr:hypothetical protein GGR55DRAFT_581998 [Xylaria sp. FL0064]
MAPSKKRPIEGDDASGPATKKHRKGFRVGPENLPDGPWRRKVDKIKKDLIHKAKVKKAYKKIKSTELATSSFASNPTLGDVNAGSVTVVKTDTGEDGKGIGGGREDSGGSGSDNDDEVEERPRAAESPSPQLHPQRQAMLNDDVSPEINTDETRKNNANRRIEGSDDDDDQPPEDNQSHRPAERERYSRQKRRPGYFDKALTMAERKKIEAAERAAEKERREAERRRRIEERERFRRAMAKARKPGRDGQRRLGRESGLLLEKVKKMVG